jgi:dTDP-3-amino-3,4,6-trideoxy-alpha-D-glucose transaminase
VFATSFYPTKNLGAIGDGGAILTNSLDLADKARILRDYGQTSKYQHTVLGYNSRLDELQAAYLNRVFLPRLDTAIQRRRQIASRYLSEIKNPHLRCPGSPPGSDSSWHLFPVLTEPGRKQTFIQHLRQLSVQCGEHYPMALIEQEALRDAKVESEIGCPQALRFCHSEVSLPIHPYLTDDQVAVVVEACSSWRP